MDKNRIKSKFKLFLLKYEGNKIIEEKNNLLYKQKLFQKRKNFKTNIINTLFFIKISLLISIKLNLISSQTINRKRNIMSQSSSIKLKIENSGYHVIYSNGTYQDCQPVIIPDEIYINGVNQSEINNEYNFENNNSEITLIWYNPLESTNCMFRDCTTITEVDLSNFDDSQLCHMQFMFQDCHSLKNVEMSNIKGYKIVDAGFLFMNCYQLESINLANFCHESNAYVHNMFRECHSLTSINFPNLNKEYTEKIADIFYGCNSLKYINIENAIITNETLSIFDSINSNQIICSHSPKLISLIKNKSALLNCTNNYCVNQTEEDDCSSLSYKYQYKNIFYEIVLMEHIIIIVLNVLIAMKSVHYAQRKVLNKIYAYHAIIQINIMKNIII